MVRSYQDLEVWQKAMDLVVVCYQLTNKFPQNEIYGLASQLQRAAVSVQRISRKADSVNIVKSFSNIYQLPVALSLKWKHMSKSQDD